MKKERFSPFEYFFPEKEETKNETKTFPSSSLWREKRMENPKEIRNPYGSMKKTLDELLKKEKANTMTILRGGKIEYKGGVGEEREEITIRIEVEI